MDNNIGCTVKVLNSYKKRYKEVIGEIGIIENYGVDSIGVRIEGFYNYASSNGIYWFSSDEIEILEHLGGIEMEGFNNIAIVNILDDFQKKDYGFALFDTECKKAKVGSLVIVNPRSKDNRIIGIIKDIIPKENYAKTVTKEVVGIVDMSGYIAREEETKRKQEQIKKRAEIEKQLKTKVEKLRDLEFYEKMARDYAEKDPELMKLVNELKSLSNE